MDRETAPIADNADLKGAFEAAQAEIKRLSKEGERHIQEIERLAASESTAHAQVDLHKGQVADARQAAADADERAISAAQRASAAEQRATAAEQQLADAQQKIAALTAAPAKPY